MSDPVPAPAGSAEDRSVGLAEANLYSLALVVPVLAALGGLYAWLWGTDALASLLRVPLDAPVATLAAIVLGVMAHEGLHALAWRLAGLPASTIRFGFSWRGLAPYAHCGVPMPARAYRWSAAAPGIVLGLVPAAAGLATGHPGTMAFGLFFTLAAAGDALILWMLRGVPPGARVEDHPSRAGCFVLPPGGA